MVSRNAKFQNGQSNSDKLKRPSSASLEGIKQIFLETNGSRSCHSYDVETNETQKAISSRDNLIAVLHQQLKRIEQLYKKEVDLTQYFKYKYYVTTSELCYFKNKFADGDCSLHYNNVNRMNKISNEKFMNTLANDQMENLQHNIERTIKANFDDFNNIHRYEVVNALDLNSSTLKSLKIDISNLSQTVFKNELNHRKYLNQSKILHENKDVQTVVPMHLGNTFKTCSNASSACESFGNSSRSSDSELHQNEQSTYEHCIEEGHKRDGILEKISVISDKLDTFLQNSDNSDLIQDEINRNRTFQSFTSRFDNMEAQVLDIKNSFAQLHKDVCTLKRNSEKSLTHVQTQTNSIDANSSKICNLRSTSMSEVNSTSKVIINTSQSSSNLRRQSLTCFHKIKVPPYGKINNLQETHSQLNDIIHTTINGLKIDNNKEKSHSKKCMLLFTSTETKQLENKLEEIYTCIIESIKLFNNKLLDLQQHEYWETLQLLKSVQSEQNSNSKMTDTEEQLQEYLYDLENQMRTTSYVEEQLKQKERNKKK